MLASPAMRWLRASIVFVAACGGAPPLEAFPEGSSTGGTSDDPESADTTSEDDDATTSASQPTSSSDPDDGSSGEPSDTTDGTTGEPVGCPPPPACDLAPPNPGPRVDWNDGESTFITASGGPGHRGRDMFYNPGDAQWVLAKFTYGPTDWDLEGEQVDLFLLRDCIGDWEPLGTALTTYEAEHETIEGVEDTGGRLYFQIPPASTLGVGRHRIAAIVRGDMTYTDVYVEIVDPGTPIFLADIDGTLTTTETEEFTALLSGSLPLVNPSAPEALWALVDRGYRPMYLTARPEFLGARTRAFITERGLPMGIIHTTLSATGALGDVAVEYKSGELATLASRGLVPHWVFGNTSSDADAYEAAGIQPLDRRVFFQYDDVHGGRRIDDYAAIVPELQGLDLVCE